MFFNAKEAQTRYKYLLYYTFSFVENSSIILVWFLYTPPSTWYVIPALTGHYLTFFGGIMFMLCYYLWFHPTGIDLSSLKFGKNADFSLFSWFGFAFPCFPGFPEKWEPCKGEVSVTYHSNKKNISRKFCEFSF